MSRRIYAMGGQRRTINAPCGWICKGAPREVNTKLKIHQRRCRECSDTELVVPEFNTTNGLINGWNGVCGDRTITGILSMATGEAELPINIKSSTKNATTAGQEIRNLITCVLCTENFNGYGNNPYPLSEDGRCCDSCNTKVIFARIKMMSEMNATL